MKVLVTGASGMLGGAVADVLAHRGDDVTVLQRRPVPRHRQVLGDLSDHDVLREATRDQDAVIHLAAKVDVVGPWQDYERVNVVGTRELIAAARRSGVGAFVYISSPSVAHSGASLAGAGAGPARPGSARGNYARSKALAENIALAADGTDLAVTAIRPHLVWGPGDTQLVGRIVARARTGRLPLIGSGTSLVDSTYVDNAADAIVAGLDRIGAARGQPLVVTNGEPRPIGELIADICRAGGAPEPALRIPASVAWAVGAAIDGVTWTFEKLPGLPTITEPPLTRFLAEQLSTAHWFDQRHTREVLDWAPRVSIDQGLVALRRAAAR